MFAKKATFFKKKLLIYDPVRRSRTSEFTAQEDALLVRGLAAFGVQDLNVIRAFCLPAKSHHHLEVRIRSLIARGTPDNIVKAVFINPFKPLNIFEKDLLRAVEFLIMFCC